MKLIKFAAIVAICGATFASCNNSAPKSNLKNGVDSLSYAMGLAQSQSLRMQLQEGSAIDTAYIDEFIKGLNEGSKVGKDKKKFAYIAGLSVGMGISTQGLQQMNSMCFGTDTTQSISLNNFMAGFSAGIKGSKTAFTVEEAQQIAQQKINELKAKSAMKQYGSNKVAGEKFLAANKKKPGVVTLPSGVQYKVLKAGTGKTIADSTWRVTFTYEGRTIDGKVFDSSNRGGKENPVTTQAFQNIPGFSEALCHMPIGSTWEIYIPQELAYQANAAGEIKPFSALIFKVTLLKAEPTGSKQPAKAPKR
ncbi:MAG: FKBP-type peptidyl-prolyl cis-trans isomerase N-terminal domain-containing protein [Prevotella sp.]|jgi:FKBP-type peptidyl-prolyl cis-trans isomerase FklB